MTNPYPAVFRDDNSDTRLAGAIDFTDPANQPGGPVLKRNVGQVSLFFGEDVTMADGVTALTLAHDAGDASMVDLTTPTLPTIVTPGVYAFTCTAHLSSTTSDAWFLSLLVDDNFYSMQPTTPGDISVYGNAATCAVWWCDAADPFAVFVATQQVAAIHPGGDVYIQRIT